jgi:hypothetical protein
VWIVNLKKGTFIFFGGGVGRGEGVTNGVAEISIKDLTLLHITGSGILTIWIFKTVRVVGCSLHKCTKPCNGILVYII